MNFAFFYPFAWLAAAAVAVPIWLHLHRRRESNLILFSALRFLEDQPIARRRPLWPRDLPLLLLRILGLLLIIAAFAWPYLTTKDSPKLITESVVYILDNTLSHQAQGNVQKARESLADQLEAAPPGRQTAVIVLDAAPRVLANFSDEPRAIAALIRKQTTAALKPSATRASYLAAFRQADQLLRQSIGQQRRIVLYVDHQTNQWEDGRQSPPFLRDVQIDFATPSLPRLPNVAVWQPKAQRTYVGDRSFVECSFRLFHQGPAEKVKLQILDGKESVGEREIILKGEPEIMSLAFEWPIKNEDWLRGTIRVSGTPDALSGDNEVVFSLAPLRPGTVNALADSVFLRTALAPEIMQDRWTTKWLDPERLTSQTEMADVLCVETSYLERKSVRDYVLAHLDEGHGLLLMIDELPSGALGLLKQLGVESSAAAQSSGDARIRYFFSEHPVFAPFRSEEFGNLLDVSVEHYRPLESKRGVPLLFAHSGEPIMLDVPAKGPLLVLGFGLDRRDTNWPIHTSFIPFLDICLRHVRPQPPTVESFVPGEACTWHVPQGLDIHELVLRSDAEVLRTPVQQGQAKFVVPQTPGLYALHYDAATQPAAMIQVNPSPAESDLTYTDPKETLAAWQIPKEVKTTPLPQLAALTPLSEASILRQQIWWWLLLSGLMALSVESVWLATRKDRR